MFRRLNLFRFFVPLCLIGIVLLGGGAKFWLIHLYGSDLPDREQWLDGQAGVVGAWAHGTSIAIGDVPPAKDYPVLARWVSQALLSANGQWDNRLLVIVNTLVHAFAVALLVALLAPRLTRTGIWLTSLAAVLLVASPLNSGEILAGSALPDSLALVLSIPAVWMLLEHTPGARDWWLGLALALLAVFASHLAPAMFAALCTVSGARAVVDRPRRTRHAITCAVALAGFVAALGLVFKLLPQPVRLDLGSPVWIARALAFPAGGWWWLLPAVHAPIAVWFWLLYRDPDRKQTLAPMLGIVATAATLIAVHLYLQRVPGDTAPTILASTALIIDVAALTWLWHHRIGREPVRAVLTIGWVAGVLFGLQVHVEKTLAVDLPRDSAAVNDTGDRLERFLNPAAHGPDSLDAEAVQRATGIVPERLRQFLRPVFVQHVLPVSIRPRVHLLAGPATTPDFSDNLDTADLPPPFAHAWVSGRGAEPPGGSIFVSRALPPGLLPVLQFRVAGDLGTPRFPMSLRSLETGETYALELDARTGTRWKNVNLFRPDDPVVLMVGPAAPGAWGAFSEPVEQGLLSWYARKITKNWDWIGIAGAAALLAAVATPFFSQRKRQDTFQLTGEGRLQRRMPAR